MQYGGGGFGQVISNGSYSFSNPVFASLASYSSLALLKMLGMSSYTLIQRFRTGNFATSEDEIYKQLLNRLGLSNVSSGTKSDAVDRARNNHFNDLENILPFVLVGLFYVGTRPKFDCALWHFRIFLFSRLLHTIAYQVFSSTSLIDRMNVYLSLGSITTTNTNTCMVIRLFKYHFNEHTDSSFNSIIKSKLTRRKKDVLEE